MAAVVGWLASVNASRPVHSSLIRLIGKVAILLYNVLKSVLSHPLNRSRKRAALLDFARWQIGARLNAHPVVYQFTERSKLLVAKGMAGATGNLYCGLHEFAEMSFLLHFLRRGDLFVDVGANVGSYTVLASAEVGAATIALEPVPSTFRWLEANVAVNGVAGLVDARNIGVAGEQGAINFTSGLDTVNHVAAAGDVDVIEVPVERLDDVVGDRAPVLIKIDVEGYETEVLRGGRRTIAGPSVRAIIIELNGSGDRYGFDDAAIHRDLLAGGFSPFAYDPLQRELLPIPTFGPHNTIYVREPEFVRGRVRSAPGVGVRGVRI